MGGHTTTTAPEIKALVLDLGGVVIRLNMARSEELLREHHPALPDGFWKTVGEWPPYDRFERGELDEAQFFHELKESFALGHIDTAPLLASWNAILGDSFEGIGQLIEEVRRKRPVYALSNTNASHHQYVLANYPELDLFDAVLTSFQLGTRKPEPVIYQGAVERLGIPAPALLFVDDRLDNVEAARQAGWQAEQSDNSPQRLREILLDYSLI